MVRDSNHLYVMTTAVTRAGAETVRLCEYVVHLEQISGDESNADRILAKQILRVFRYGGMPRDHELFCTWCNDLVPRVKLALEHMGTLEILEDVL